MECLIMTYGRDFDFDSYMIFEFQAMSTCWPNVDYSLKQQFDFACVGFGLRMLIFEFFELLGIGVTYLTDVVSIRF